MQISLPIYKFCCETRKSDIPLFQQDWWLDTVCGSAHWDAWVQTPDSKSADCIWPVYKKRFGPLQYLTMPPMTLQFDPLDPDVLPDWNMMMNHYPRTLYQRLCVPGYMERWLLQYGFEVFRGYTYQVDYTADAGEHLKKCNELSRRNIRKAAAQLEVIADGDAETLYQLFRQSMQGHGLPVSMAPDLLVRTVDACLLHEQGAVFKAVDAQGRVHAAAFVVWDSRYMYYVLAGMDEKIEQIGASRLIMWHTMQLAFSKKLRYDFHGGMTPKMGSVYASMGATPVPQLRASLYRPACIKQIIATAKRIYAPNDNLFH